MEEQEERRLRQDAEITGERAAVISKAKLDSAVRRGIGEGRNRARRQNFLRIAGGGLAFAAALLLMLTVLRPAGDFGPDAPESAQQDWGTFEVFREKAEGDMKLTGILNRGAVVPLNGTIQKNGYTVTLKGAAADSRSMILLYSVKNDTAQPALIDGSAVEYPKGLRAATSYSGDVRLHSGETSYHTLSVSRTGKIEESSMTSVLNLIVTPDTPEAMISSSWKYRTEIAVPFELDLRALSAGERTTEYDRVLTVDGQRIHVRRTVVTPIATYVDVAYDKGNTKQIFGLIRSRLIAESGGRTEELAWLGSSSISETDTEESLEFESAASPDIDSLTLAIDGISALDRDKLTLVVDTDAMRVIKAPDSRISLEPAGTEYGKGYIAFKRTGGTPTGMAANMQLDYTFTDGNGVEHSSEGGDQSGTVSYSQTDADGAEVSLEYVYIGEKKWPQPLTFHIVHYPNPIMEAVKVRID
ncbi:DUF4179 domain-containing protein [Saccharibacillus qingshengii]|uniref:DUF4179 domain-containing protein n=1 Tax=Saccharibacillus qingshengii TaxID=1763540 RepID=UPI0015529941|nr:DUF4179 domain-containing protein [Saccharibacillus qingshengii]